METLRRNDLAAILEFLRDVAELGSKDLYAPECLARLGGLVPCDAITYQEIEPAKRRWHVVVEYDPELGADDDDEVDVYWQVGPCPTTAYRADTGDLRALRMSDVVTRRRFHELPIYREYFRPGGTDHVLDFGLPSQPGRHRGFLFFRNLGSRDFTDRDLAVLEMLRPHLHRMEAQAALLRRLAVASQDDDPGRDDMNDASLSPREREVIELVAQGKTNAEIASVLWVAPSTVKKHLENIYAKIGIGRRAAAVAGYAVRSRVPPRSSGRPHRPTAG